MLPQLTLCIREHHLLASLLNPETVAIDLGANDGRFAQALHDYVGCEVHSIEALPELASALKTNDRLHAYHYAIAAHNGSISMNVSPNSEANSRYAVHDTTAVIEVPAVTLSEFIAAHSIKPTFLKVDIEGSEIDLIESLDRESLAQFEQITIEFHDFVPEWKLKEKTKAAKKKIISAGFYCIKFSRTSHFDVLFINKKRISMFLYLYLNLVEKNILGLSRLLARRLAPPQTQPIKSIDKSQRR